MKYVISYQSSNVPDYKSQLKIVSGPDKYGTCKVVDEKINNTFFINTKDLKPLD